MSPILLLPGWGMPPSAYPELGQDRTVDYGFFGGAAPFRFAAAAAELAAAVPAGTVLCGHSLGALLALRLALALPAGRVRALVLFAPVARFTADDGAGWPGQPRAVVAAMARRLPEEAVTVLRGFHRNAAWPERWAGTMPGAPQPAALAAGLDVLMEMDLREEVANLALPVLMLHGTADRIVPPAQAERLAALLPQARLRPVAEAGHLLPLTRAELCRQAVMESVDEPS